MLVVGFSTGALALGDFELGLRLLEDKSANAVELSALRVSELPLLLAKLPERVESLQARYQYISFHAPSDFRDERGIVGQLAQVAELGWNIIVHPDTIREVEVWRELGSLICLENMDSRKATGRTAEELAAFFAKLPDAKLCFDIAHARQVDPTMTEAARILSDFGALLAEVHLSEVDGRGKHFPMSYGAKRAYEQFSDVLSQVPNILESIVSEDRIELEIEAARRTLTHYLRDEVHASSAVAVQMGE